MGNRVSVTEQNENSLKKRIEMQNQIINCLKKENEHLSRINEIKNMDKNIIDEINDVKIKKDYEYLVLSGGGIKGISFLGVLYELEQMGILYDSDKKLKLKGIAGVSAGSIIASLLAVGYTPIELKEIVTTIDLAKLTDIKYSYLGTAINFIDDWGLFNGNYVIELLGELIEKKTGNADYTINDLYNDTGVKLIICVTNVSCEKSEYLYAGNPIKEYSDIPICVAVRMSMGIPGMFEPYLYSDNHYFVDGGTLDNYPLHVFDGEYPGDRAARVNSCEANCKVLGVKIFAGKGSDSYDGNINVKFSNLFSYFMSFINMFLVENDRRNMNEVYWLRTIVVRTPAYSLVKFDISDDEIMELITIGRESTSKFFEVCDDKENE